MLIRVCWLLTGLLRFVPLTLVIRRHVIIFECFLRLVDVLDVVHSVLSLDDVGWLNAGAWSAVDKTLRGELGLLDLSEVFFLLLIFFLSFLDFGLRFCDLALGFELFGQLLIYLRLDICKSLLGLGGKVLHLFFADGALLSLLRQRLKLLNLHLGFLHLG